MIILHIGTHKTGTTALQRVLSASRDFLRTQGVCYPQLIDSKQDGHHDLAWVLRPETYAKAKKGYWDMARAQITDARCDLNVLSTEGFWFVDPEAVKAEIASLGQDVKIVVYLRRQDRYLESLYKQVVKIAGIPFTFEAWLKDKLFRGDYLPTLQAWEAAFGRERMDVRLYDTDQGSIDLIEEFLNLLGVKDRSGLSGLGHLGNPSPRKELIGLLLAMNQLPIKLDRLKMFQTLAKRNPQYIRSSDMLSGDQRRALMAHYEAGNEAIRQSYFPEKIAGLFPPVEDVEPEIWTINHPAYTRLVADFVDVFTQEVAKPSFSFSEEREKRLKKVRGELGEVKPEDEAFAFEGE